MSSEAFPHQVVADIKATGLRVGVLMRAAYEIAGAAWNAWWRDREGLELVVAFVAADAAEQFRTWLEMQAD